MRDSRIRTLVAPLLMAAALLQAGAASTVCNPIPQWTWRGPAESPSFPEPCSTPLVVQLTDDNGDGRINAADSPDVLFSHGKSVSIANSLLTAVEGSSRRTIFTEVGPDFFPETPAAGDLDGDGVVEIVAVTIGKRVVAWDHEGNELWQSDRLPLPPDLPTLRTPIGIADLDQDGRPEIYLSNIVLDSGGRLLWAGREGRGGPAGFWMAASNAVDLVPSNPGLEILAGRTAYAADGTVLWNNIDVPDGFTAVADFDGDADPEIVLTEENVVYLLDHLGRSMGEPRRLPPSHLPVPNEMLAQPVTGDLDGDGLAEAFVIGRTRVEALEWSNGAFRVMWSRQVRDHSSLNGAAAFDFDADGDEEIVYHDERNLYIFDGATGEDLDRFSFHTTSGTETPVIADIDGDGVTELLASGCGVYQGPTNKAEVRAYECAGPEAARAVWNQYTYHVTNVAPGGGIPRVEPEPWLAHDVWLGQSHREEGGPPVCEAGPEVEAPCDGVSLSGSAEDPDGDALTLQWSADCPGVVFEPDGTVPAPVVRFGTSCGVDCTLTLSASDGNGGACSDRVRVRVNDDRPPVLSPPSDITLECGEPTGTARCGEAAAVDNCDGRIDPAHADRRVAGRCPGDYDIMRGWLAVDACGNISSSEQEIRVRDTTPPEVVEGSDDLYCMWPPNHKYVAFDRSGFDPGVGDTCSEPVVWVFDGCHSSQSDDGPGDGHTPADCLLSPDGSGFQVRAERSGLDPEGRRYQARIVAADACGNLSASRGIGYVHVPHDQDPREKACIRP